MDKQRIGIQRK